MSSTLGRTPLFRMYNPVGYSSIGSVNVSLKGDILLLAIGYDKLAMPRVLRQGSTIPTGY